MRLWPLTLLVDFALLDHENLTLVRLFRVTAHVCAVEQASARAQRIVSDQHDFIYLSQRCWSWLSGALLRLGQIIRSFRGFWRLLAETLSCGLRFAQVCQLHVDEQAQGAEKEETKRRAGIDHWPHDFLVVELVRQQKWNHRGWWQCVRCGPVFNTV